MARRLGVQAKLKVGRSDDPLEVEADDVAQRALDDTAVTEPRTGQGPGAASRLQRAGGASSAASAEAAGVGGVLRSPGEPLAGGTRSFFEQRLGADLSAVRVHTRAEAAASADALGARAYTVGSDLVFGRASISPRPRPGGGCSRTSSFTSSSSAASEPPSSATTRRTHRQPLRSRSSSTTAR